jgi:acyl-CoA reductase-like NAD-dependent aldehyde dehydrogenase
MWQPNLGKEFFRDRCGSVWANIHNKFDPTSPFCGYKESGSHLRQGFGGAGRSRRQIAGAGGVD